MANEKSIFEFFTQPKFSLSSEPPFSLLAGKLPGSLLVPVLDKRMTFCEGAAIGQQNSVKTKSTKPSELEEPTMGAGSLNDDESRIIHSSAGGQVKGMAVARLYKAQGNSWQYSNLWGAATLVAEDGTHTNPTPQSSELNSPFLSSISFFPLQPTLAPTTSASLTCRAGGCSTSKSSTNTSSIIPQRPSSTPSRPRMPSWVSHSLTSRTPRPSIWPSALCPSPRHVREEEEA